VNTLAKAPPRPDEDAHRRKILLVDDEPALVNSVKRLLGPLGYKVLDAPSALHAQRILAREKDIKCVVSDQKMPGPSGLELIRHCSIYYPFVGRVMYVAAVSPDIEALQIRPVPFFEVVVKAVDDLYRLVDAIEIEIRRRNRVR
jgi:CheY-like chemotaxis protein